MNKDLRDVRLILRDKGMNQNSDAKTVAVELHYSSGHKTNLGNILMNLMQKMLALLLITSTPAYCLDQIAEYQQKTRLVRYIINKVSWPAGSIRNNQFNICVSDDVDHLKIVEKLNGQTIKKYKVVVKSFKPKDKLHSCQLIYVANKDTEQQMALINKFKKRPVLLLGDMEHFANLGGSMNFVVLQQNVALTINLESMANSKLKMDIKELDQVILVPEDKDLN